MGDYHCLRCKRDHNFRSRIGEEHRKFEVKIPDDLRGGLLQGVKEGTNVPAMLDVYLRAGLKRDGLIE